MMTTSRFLATVVFSGIGLSCSLEVFQDFESSQSARPAHNAPARMRRRSAHVKVLDGGAELRPARQRPQEEKLLQRQLALKDITFAQPKVAFQIKGSDHLSVQDDVLDIGRVLGDGVDDIVAEGLLLIVPVQAGPQLVRRVL